MSSCIEQLSPHPKQRARLAIKGTRLVKQGGDFSCWEVDARSFFVAVFSALLLWYTVAFVLSIQLLIVVAFYMSNNGWKKQLAFGISLSPSIRAE